MKNNRKGAALMQVLLMTIVLAGMATVILRATLARTNSARQTRRAVSAQLLIESCMAEVNSVWANKTPETFLRDLRGIGNNGTPYMYCTNLNSDGVTCNGVAATYTCKYDGDNYQVTAKFVKKTGETDPDKDIWQIEYEVSGATADIL